MGSMLIRMFAVTNVCHWSRYGVNGALEMTFMNYELKLCCIGYSQLPEPVSLPSGIFYVAVYAYRHGANIIRVMTWQVGGGGIVSF